MSLKLNGATSGYVEIDAPAVAGSTSITLPATSGGEFIVSDASGNIDLGALDISGSAAADSVNIDSSGRLLVGTSTALSNIYIKSVAAHTPTVQFQSQNNSNYGTGLSITNASISGYGPAISLNYSAGSQASPTIAQEAGDMGIINFTGYDGSNYICGAAISGVVNGTPGNADMPGALVFSTTADGNSSPTERFRISQDGSFWAIGTNTFEFATTAVAGSSELFRVRNAATTVGTGITAFVVLRNGNTLNANGSYTTISDAKLKENIVDAGSQWDDLKAIKIRNWNFKEGIGYETHRQIGPIAQELEEVCPGLVCETLDQDDEGNETGEVTKGVNQSVLYMKAVKALQEAMERIETLETQNASFEARLTALEGGQP